MPKYLFHETSTYNTNCIQTMINISIMLLNYLIRYKFEQEQNFYDNKILVRRHECVKLLEHFSHVAHSSSYIIAFECSVAERKRL